MMPRLNLSNHAILTGLGVILSLLGVGGPLLAAPPHCEGPGRSGDDLSQGVQRARLTQQAVGIEFKQPDTDEVSDPSDRPRGGGSRPICDLDASGSLPCTELRLTALVPFPQAAAGAGSARPSAWGQTLEPIPTFWFYVPYPPDSIHTAEFEVWDSEGTLVWQDPHLVLAQTPGIMAYRPALPQTLAVGQTYRWHLLLRFDPDHPSADAHVTGRVQRIATSAELTQQLAIATTPLQTARALAKNGIWYDTLTALAKVYPEQPEVWMDLLRSVGLEQVAAQKLVMMK